MNHKIGRNDACPCGSGRKYKHCCCLPPTPAGVGSHEGAVARALVWLRQHHRKALAAALDTVIESSVFEVFDNIDDVREAIANMSEELWQQVQINFTEWLLAEGDIRVEGETQRVSELLLGPHGPLLTVDQRAWLEQLASRPLRLYDVTEVVPGATITLCDALDIGQLPIVVTERAGRRTLKAGMQLGARVMEVAGQHQLSGAIYPFLPGAGREAQRKLRALAEPGMHEEDAVPAIGLMIMDAWVQQHLGPAPLPQIVHATTGEPLLFVTDHYDVGNWDALTAALDAQTDLDGNRESGWSRLVESTDGLSRPLATITAAPGGRRVSVVYQTAGLAQQGRAWFDALAGESVRFLLQEVSDPQGLLSQAHASAPTVAQRAALPEGIDRESLSDAIEAMLKRHYAHWADEPIAALNGQTPRQAIQSAAELERVKGLLRSYEDGEARQAEQQGRREMSYQFLWDALGLK